MSATLTYNGSFELLEETLGLKLPVTCTMLSPFAPSSRTFVVPRMTHPYNASRMTKRTAEGVEYAHENLVERVEWIVRCIARNEPTKSTLVVGSSTEDVRAVRALLETDARLASLDLTHIDFADESAFAAFASASTPRASIVYGMDNLCTGVDLPGRLGLVVVLKTLAKPLTSAELYAKNVLQCEQEMWTHWTGRRVTMFVQAAGRLVRTDGDRGTVLLVPTDKGVQPERGAIMHFYRTAAVSTVDG